MSSYRCTKLKFARDGNAPSTVSGVPTSSLRAHRKRKADHSTQGIPADQELRLLIDDFATKFSDAYAQYVSQRMETLLEAIRFEAIQFRYSWFILREPNEIINISLQRGFAVYYGQISIVSISYENLFISQLLNYFCSAPVKITPQPTLGSLITQDIYMTRIMTQRIRVLCTSTTHHRGRNVLCRSGAEGSAHRSWNW